MSSPWWIRYGGRIGITLVGIALVLIGWNFVASNVDRDRVAAQHRVAFSLERLLSSARDIETSSRGYVLVGEDGYLEPYRATLADLPALTAELRSAWQDTGGRPEILDPLFAAYERKRAYTAKLIDARREGGLESARALAVAGGGKDLMDALRADVARLQEGARVALHAVEANGRARTLVLTGTSMAAAFAAVLYLGWVALYRRRLAQHVSTELAGLGDRFQTLADNIPQLTWMADASGDIHWYNKRWYDYTGLTPADMANVGWRKVHDPDYVEGVTARYLEAIRSGEPWQDTFPLRRFDGEYRWFLSLAQPIRNARGEVVRWFGSNTDVTEQRTQEQSLADARTAAEDANRAKSQFLANMSHELRTPLSAVIGYTEMMEEEVEELGEKQLLDDLDKIKSNARHLLGLINDVLDISKIEANKMEVYAEPFDVAEVLRDVVTTVEGLVEKKGNRLLIEIPDDLGTMHSDVVKIRQILINFLSNAAKFTEGGEVHLGAHRLPRADGDAIAFTVRDTGLGMTPEQVDNLFQRFTQADLSTTRRFGGTGLGLAITKAFVELLGGSVEVLSEPAVGSTFTTVLPLTYGARGEEIATDDDHDGVVLVIDDDPATRDLLTRFLGREGYVVRTAGDGQTGLELARSLRPRVILLDVTMPRMDGWTVLRSLKSDQALASIPVVMCTIINEQNLGYSLGASDYLLKPVNWDHLRDVLGRLAADSATGDVLVIEDDADTRERLSTILTKNGWPVLQAENGRAALDRLGEEVPALVLLDLNMPEMDGFTFLREFRAHPSWTNVPVVVMTARDLSASERAELKGGDARVLEKGRVSMSDLVSELRRLHPPSGPAKPAATEAAA